MQVIPFLLAFLVGASLSENTAESDGIPWRGIAQNAATSFAGFTIVFSSIGMVTTGISKILFRYNELLNQFGGVIIGLIGLSLLGWLTIKQSSKLSASGMRLGFGLLLGASLGIAYKPCVTPTLTVIFSMNTSPDNVPWAGFLLALYALGISTATLLFGIPLAAYATRLKSAKARDAVKKGCGILLVIVAVLMLTDKMTAYKSLLVEGFVPAATDEDGTSNHNHHIHSPDGQMPTEHEHSHGE